jgi:hypothetical protein
MKKQILACVLFSLAFLLSCSDEKLPSGNFEPLAKVQNTNNRIDMQEATNVVEEAIAFLDSEHPSEFKSSRTVNSVSILRFGGIKSSMMKSGEYNEALDISDTLAYVFNFEDSLGYVIISNDKRIESPLLAFTQKGSLVNGETDNPGLKIFLERLEGYILESIAKYGKTDGQKAMDVAQSTGPYSGPPLDTVVKPLVPVEWDQGKPFNNHLEDKNCYGTGTANNGKVWAGCVATAIAQIMSYWEYPASIGNITYLWDNLNKYKHAIDFEPSPTDSPVIIAKKKFTSTEVAYLFQQIGAGVKMDYKKGCEGSGATNKNALAFLASKGFTLSGDLTDYSYSFVKPFLEAHRPLYASGCSPPATFFPEKRCHAWVIDGFAKGTNFKYYIHNNWGWDGSSNGYYASGVFDPTTLNFQNVQVSAVYR